MNDGAGNMIRFQFQLRPLADVAPWGSDGEHSLHWFGLTDGWYWIAAQGHQLLRYSQPVLDPPYVDYYVVRFWEDLLELVQNLTEPVPDDVISFIRSDTNYVAAWPDGEDLPDDEAIDAALTVGCDHILDFGYIRTAPLVKCWRHRTDGDDLVTFIWKSAASDGIAFAGPESLELSMPASEFLAAVEDLDRRLMTAMEQRVRELEATGAPAEVHIDFAQLRAEHADRSTWLAKGLAANRHIDWGLVRTGIQTLNAAVRD